MISVKGTSIGTPIATRPGVGGTMAMVAGNGQDGLVSAGVMRVSASMPSVSVRFEASMRGCAAIARIGRNSSHSVGIVEPAVVPCSGIERQALAHCTRAFCSKAGSLRMRACTSAICSATFLSISGFTCAGTLTRAPATLRLESLRLTWAVRFGSMRQFASIFGRAVITTLPLISALAFRFLMFTLPICFATLPPSRPPSASPTAPVAFADSEPVTLSVPVSGVASDSTSCAPLAAIGPREAVQPMSAFCRICEIGLSALPANERGAPRSAASRIADSATAIGAITVDARGAGGSGGNSASAGARFVARGATKSITFRLATNETMTTASAIETVFRCIGRRIVPRTPK